MDIETSHNGDIRDKLNSNEWKARSEAYDECIKRLEKGEESVKQVLAPFLSKALKESVPSATEKGLNLAVLYFTGASEENKSNYQRSEDDYKDILKALIEKVYASNRPNLSSNCTKLLCSVFQLADKQQVSEAIIDSIGSSNIKVQVAGINVVRELLINFGLKNSQTNQYMQKILPKCSVSNPDVRHSCMEYLKELSKWQGDSLLGQLKGLKNVQVEEIKTFIAAYKKDNQGKPPNALIGGSKTNQVPVNDQSQNQNYSKNQTEQINQEDNDLWEDFEPVKVIHKFTESWCDKVCAEVKWLEKKEKLDQLERALIVPRIEAANYGHITKMIKKLLNESSIPVHLVCLNIIKRLCKGLRKKFDLGIKSLNRSLLMKLKERKTIVTDTVLDVLNCSFESVSLDEVIEEYRDVLKEKNPQTKHHILNILSNQVHSGGKTTLNSQSVLKSLISCCKDNLNDGSPEVRKVSIELLGDMLRLLPKEPNLLREITSIEEKKREKIIERSKVGKQSAKSIPPHPESNINFKDKVQGGVPFKKSSSVSKYPAPTRDSNISGKTSTPQIQIKKSFSGNSGITLENKKREDNKQTSKHLPIVKKSNSVELASGSIIQYSSIVEEIKGCMNLDEANCYLSKE